MKLADPLVVLVDVLALAHDFFIALGRFLEQRERHISVVFLQLQVVDFHVALEYVARTRELLGRADHLAEDDYLLEQKHASLFDFDLFVFLLLGVLRLVN